MKNLTHSISARIPEETALQFSKICEEKCLNKSAVLVRLLEQWLKDQIPGEKKYSEVL